MPVTAFGLAKSNAPHSAVPAEPIARRTVPAVAPPYTATLSPARKVVAPSTLTERASSSLAPPFRVAFDRPPAAETFSVK